MEVEKIHKEIVQVMALIAKNKQEEAALAIEGIEERINDMLDFAQTDEEVVSCGKLLKILEELK